MITLYRNFHMCFTRGETVAFFSKAVLLARQGQFYEMNSSFVCRYKQDMMTVWAIGNQLLVWSSGQVQSSFNRVQLNLKIWA